MSNLDNLFEIPGKESPTGSQLYDGCEDVNNPLAKVEKPDEKVLMSKTSISKNDFIALNLDSEGNQEAVDSLR